MKKENERSVKKDNEPSYRSMKKDNEPSYRSMKKDNEQVGPSNSKVASARQNIDTVRNCQKNTHFIGDFQKNKGFPNLNLDRIINDRYEEVADDLIEGVGAATQELYEFDDETDMTINETTVDYTAREIMNIEQKHMEQAEMQLSKVGKMPPLPNKVQRNYELSTASRHLK